MSLSAYETLTGHSLAQSYQSYLNLGQELLELSYSWPRAIRVILILAQSYQSYLILGPELSELS